MPIPLLIPVILGGPALVSALFGIKKGYRGVTGFKEAKKIADNAKERHEKALERLEYQRRQVINRAERYAGRLEQVTATTIKRMISILESLNKKAEAKSLIIPDGIHVTPDKIREYKNELSSHALNVLKGVGKAAGAGAAAKTGAISLVMGLGKAGTGAAITGLKGVAATNATLAWLGGGSLAAGGGGMAVGTVVLGGIAVAPALVVCGLVVAKQGQKQLTKAREYEAEVEVAIATIESTIAFLKRLIVRVDELDSLVQRLDKRANDTMDGIDVAAFDFRSDRDVGKLTLALQLAHSLTELIRTTVLEEDGQLSEASKNVIVKYRNLAV